MVNNVQRLTYYEMAGWVLTCKIFYEYDKIYSF